jgi:hypothetical protein
VTGIPLFITGTCRLSLRRFRYGEDASTRGAAGFAAES